MNETEQRKHRCCFTGRQPEKLKIPEKRLALLLEEEIRKAIAGGSGKDDLSQFLLCRLPGQK